MPYRRRRSVLYLPASNERAIAKATTLPCDVVILDLEDAVAPDAKATAREQAVAALRQGGFGAREVVVRVNGLDDVAALRGAEVSAILAPKVSSAADVDAYAARLWPGARLWVMIETARALFRLEEIADAAPGALEALVLGTNDLAKETGARIGADRTAMLGSLWRSVAAARAGSLAAIDGVYNDIADLDGFTRQACEARDLGFDGKTLIHPSQIEPCHAAFAPSADEVREAERIVAAFDAPESALKGAVKVDGRMVERLHLAAAHRTLATAAGDPSRRDN